MALRRPGTADAKPFRTLLYLIENHERVVSRAELLQQVWGEQREVSTVHQVVKTIRHALNDRKDTPAYIETVPGYGYRFIAPVSLRAAEVGSIKPKRKLRVPFGIAAAVLTVAAALALGAFYSMHPAPAPARMTSTRNALIAWDDAGRMLWKHVFERNLAPAVPMSPLKLDETLWRTQIVDLDGGGQPEVLFAAIYEHTVGTSGEQELFCFSSSGRSCGATGQIHVWCSTPEI